MCIKVHKNLFELKCKKHFSYNLHIICFSFKGDGELEEIMPMEDEEVKQFLILDLNKEDSRFLKRSIIRRNMTWPDHSEAGRK